jgi:hypothetical protein
MKRARSLILAATLVAAFSSPAMADEDRPYTEGNVVNVSYIKVKPGMFDAYMKYLATTYKQQLEEQKKAGIVVDYAIYQADARTPDGADLILTTVYKNWAALDGLEDKLEPIQAKAFGSRDQSNTAAIDRESMRTLLGSEMIQQLVLK